MFSSWSLRGWLMFEQFNIPCRTHMVGLYCGTMADDMVALAPARLVPVVRTPDGTLIGESLAIAETLAEQHVGLWPSDVAARATARWLCAEMTAGFAAVRDACPMQLQYCNVGFKPSKAVQTDLARVETLWAHARAVSGSTTPYLFGEYSLADVFYTPMAARIIGYGLPVCDDAMTYCHTLLADPAVVAWRKMAHDITYDPDPYDKGLTKTAWPDFD